MKVKLDEKKTKVIKEMVQSLLEQISKEKDAVEEHQKRLKVLKADLKDLELGRLDLIRERQEKDPEAREISVVNLKTLHDAVFITTTDNNCLVGTYAHYSTKGLLPTVRVDSLDKIVSSTTAGTYVLENGRKIYVGKY